ncbi:hypothetical protein L1887_46710 [Cichorium endivia]|nr:hypothetical protein L1887_46710 [Cichorium endivia]
MCMAKVYGVTFLGAPRTREAENACCAPLLMGVSVVALALCCIAGGVAAPWLLPLLGNTIPLPLTVANTTVSQPMIALLLIGAPLLPLVLMLFFKRDRFASRSRGAAWACGYEHEQSMVITAHGFAMPVKENFAAVLKLRHWLNPVGWVPGWQSAAAPALFRRAGAVRRRAAAVGHHARGARPDAQPSRAWGAPGVPRSLQAALPSERRAGYRRLGLPPDAVCYGGRDADHRHRAAGGDGGVAAARAWRSDHAYLPLRHRPLLLCDCGPGHREPVYRHRCQPRGDARRAGGADPAAGAVGCRAGRGLYPHQLYHPHRLPLAGGALDPAGATGGAAYRVQRLRLRGAEVGHQPQTAGGAADVCRRLLPVGADDALLRGRSAAGRRGCRPQAAGRRAGDCPV